jgi:hypothetical protein
MACLILFHAFSCLKRAQQSPYYSTRFPAGAKCGKTAESSFAAPPSRGASRGFLASRSLLIGRNRRACPITRGFSRTLGRAKWECADNAGGAVIWPASKGSRPRKKEAGVTPAASDWFVLGNGHQRGQRIYLAIVVHYFGLSVLRNSHIPFPPESARDFRGTLQRKITHG